MTRLLLVFHVVVALVPPVNADDAIQLAPTYASVSYGHHKSNILDFWKAKGEGPRPLVIYIHGGGWVNDSGRKRPKSRIEPFLNAGISYANIGYRLSTIAPLPAPVHDVARGLQFIRSKAEEWNIDKSRVGLFGRSAGGTTAMWILLHDDLADPESLDPVLQESTRVTAAAVRSAQASIDPKVIVHWIGPNVLKHRMISMAVGEKTIEGALINYEKHRNLYQEFSPLNHLTEDDPPLFMYYRNDMTLPSRDAVHGIHHPVFGVKIKEKADVLGTEAHLVIPGISESKKYKSAYEFLIDKLLMPDS